MCIRDRAIYIAERSDEEAREMPIDKVFNR